MNPGTNNKPAKTPGSQAGMALLLGLIFLSALSLLGLSASADTILQNQLFANLQDTERSKQYALATLSWAENWLLELESPMSGKCTEPCISSRIQNPGKLSLHPENETVSWWVNHGYEVGIDPLTGLRKSMIASGNTNQRLWVIEVLHVSPASENPASDLQVWYRILARGGIQTMAVVSVIESIVVRSFPSSEENQLPGTATSTTCSDSGSVKKCGRVSWRELR